MTLKSHLQLFHGGDRRKLVEALDISERTARRWLSEENNFIVEDGEIVEYKRIVKGKLKPLKITIICNVPKRRLELEKELAGITRRFVTLKSRPDLVLVDKPKFHVFGEHEILNRSAKFNVMSIEQFKKNYALLTENIVRKYEK